MDYTVICESGSDASYDLLIEVVRPRPAAGVALEAIDDAQRARAAELLAGLTAQHPLCTREDLGCRITLFQRTPERWVFAARLEALAYKLEQMRI